MKLQFLNTIYFLLTSFVWHQVVSNSTPTPLGNDTGKSLGRQNGKEVYEYEGHRYSFYLEPKTWEQASQICEMDNSYLAIAETVMEVDFLSRAMDGLLCSNTIFQNVWLGGRFYPKAGNRWLWPMTGYEIVGRPGDHGNYPPWKLSLLPNHFCLNLNQELNHQPTFVDLDCTRKRRFVCENGCSKLYDTDRGFWKPDACLLDPSHLGDQCSMVCQSGYELDGDKTVTCAVKGWNASIGLNRIPDCKSAVEIAGDIMDGLKSQITLDALQMIFVMDESISITREMFNLSLSFIETIIRAYPLSDFRNAGMFTYGTSVRVISPLATSETCPFINNAEDCVQSDESASGNLRDALNFVKNEVTANVNKRYFIIIICGSYSTIPPEFQLIDSLKKLSTIMVLGVGENFKRQELIAMASNVNDEPLFYSVSIKENMAIIIDSIKKRLGESFVETCPRVECEAFSSSTLLGHWEPDFCLKTVKENKTCELICENESVLFGNPVLTCSKIGWTQSNGSVSEIPDCKELSPEEKAMAVVKNIRENSKEGPFSTLYVVDQTFMDFEAVKHFVQCLTYLFPLSDIERAGLISFSSSAAVQIPLVEKDTCTFIKKVNKTRQKGNNSESDFDAAISLAELEIQRNNGYGKTFLIVITNSDGSNKTAEYLKGLDSQGNKLIVISSKPLQAIEAIAKNIKDRIFRFSSSDDFSKALLHLNSTIDFQKQKDCFIKCNYLRNTSRGEWNPSICSQKDSKEGQKCRLVCRDEFDLVGSNPLICGSTGWTGTAGDFMIPECKAPEEIAKLLLLKINGSIGYGINSNLLFILDESGSIGKQNFLTEKEFVISVVEAFPLSTNRTAGVFTFASQTELHIPLNSKDSCTFIQKIMSIGYNGGGTDINGALLASREEIKRRGVHNQSLIFLITDGISQTDPEPIASQLKDEGKIIFIIGVADYDQEQLEPLSSIGPDGTTNFFGIKSFNVFRVIAHYLNTTFGIRQLSCARTTTKMF